MAGGRNVAGGEEYASDGERCYAKGEKHQARIPSFTLGTLSAMAVGAYGHILHFQIMADHTTLATNRNPLGLDRPVVLVGLMGAGKSTVGRRLARDIGLDFVDSDQEIAEAAGCSIADIFEIYGETIFRDLEKRVILRLVSGDPAVVATGGGAFMNAEIREAVKRQSISVWLKADLDVLVERVSRRDTRPLLQKGDKRATLERLMSERHPFYAEADITIESDEGAHEKVVSRIAAQLAIHKEEKKA